MSTVTRGTPLYFGTAERPLFGMIHRPATGTSRGDVGVVVCNPFGYEQICAHRSLRHLAERLAADGTPALRFDYDGTGDSAGSDWDAERLLAWVKSVHHAIAAMLCEPGISGVAVVGVRLGALVGALGSLGQDAVRGYAAVAPVVNGKAYVRELKALQRTLHLTEAPTDAKKHEGVEEAVGFVLTADTRSSLSAVDLLKLERPPARRVLLVDRDDFPPNEKLASHLTELGAEVARERLPGTVEMLADPHKNKVPDAMWNAVVTWVRELRAASAPAVDGAAREDQTQASFPAARAAGRAIVERATFVDPERRLFAVVSAPAGPDGQPDLRGGRALLWLNAGSIAHIGPNRMTVALARSFASDGWVVVRMDVSGIGESAPAPGEEENVVYTERSRADTRAALGFLRDLGAKESHAIGLCSGAYNALKAAVAGQAWDTVVMVNPATFFWKPGMSLDFEYRESRVKREASRYKRAALDPKSWLKLLRGKVKVEALVQILSRRAVAIAETSAREIARRVGRPMPDDLGAELETVAKRGVPMHFVFASGEPGLELLETQGGGVARRLRARGRITLEIIEGPDHTFTPLWAQEKLASVLARHFGRARSSRA